jgi:hypothetical protein
MLGEAAEAAMSLARGLDSEAAVSLARGLDSEAPGPYAG